MNYYHPNRCEIYGRYYVTKNPREGFCTIYTKEGEFLSIVDDGELMTELERLEHET